MCDVYDVDRGVVMEPMQGKLASSIRNEYIA